MVSLANLNGRAGGVMASESTLSPNVRTQNSGLPVNRAKMTHRMPVRYRHGISLVMPGQIANVR